MKMMTLTAAALLGIMLAGSAMAACPQERGNHRQGGHMLEKLDRNHDGTVSKGEYIAFQERRFDRLDANRNGRLTEQEIESFWQKRVEKHDEKVRELNR